MAALCLGALCVASAAAQSVHTDPAHHWSVTVPPGWARMPRPPIDMANAEARKRSPSPPNFTYIDGFVPDPATSSLPYVLVQFTNTPLRGASYQDAEKALGGVRSLQPRLAERVGDAMSNLQIGKPTLDAAHNRFYLPLDGSLLGGGNMKALCVGFLGRDGIIQFNFYAAADKFDESLRQFQPFIDSFAYESGHEFVPTTGAGQRTPLVVQALLGAAVGVVVAALLVLRRRKAAG